MRRTWGGLGRPSFFVPDEWLMVLDKSWLLDLGMLRPALLQLNDAERNRAKPHKEKHNANNLFVHELDPSFMVMADRPVIWGKAT